MDYGIDKQKTEQTMQKTGVCDCGVGRNFNKLVQNTCRRLIQKHD